MASISWLSPSSRFIPRHKFSPTIVSKRNTNGIRGGNRQVLPGTFEPVPVRISTMLAAQHKQGKIGPSSTVTDESGVHEATELFTRAANLSGRLTNAFGNLKAVSARVALLLPNDSRYIVSQWATWMCGAVVVPLHRRLPAEAIAYHLQDSGSTLMITTDELKDVVEGLDKEVRERVQIVSLAADGSNELAEPEIPIKPTPSWTKTEFQKLKKRPAQIIYTSGTTGPPKGVVTMHCALDAQTRSVAHDWLLTSEDHILHHLPLHHTHGILNGLMAPLWAGSSIRMLPRFDPAKVWETLLSEDNPVNVMMAVPTMYAKLVSFAKERLWERREEIRDFLKLKLRLCTCGSAPLSLPLLHDWADLTGHVMLERYGMTEFGMGIGGDSFDHSLRRPGTVGRPFSGIQIRLSEGDGYTSRKYRTMAELTKHSTAINTEPGERTIGEIFVKGPQLFSHYHDQPEETAKAFTKDGWFKTGDMAEIVQHESKYLVKILGRRKMDFIKCGGYKISALEVQNVLESAPDIVESAVFGVPDITWGERVVAVVVARDAMNENEILEHCKKSLPPSSIPSDILQAAELPRNVMGKIDKNALRNEYLQRSRSSGPGSCVT